MITVSLLLAGLTVSLAPQAQVRGTEITLGEVATVSGGTAAENAKLAAFHLGYAPAPGYSRLLKGELIAQQVRHALPGENITVSGSRACRVTPEVVVVQAERIKSVARAELDTALGLRDAVVSLSQPLQAVTVPVGRGEQALALRASMRSASLAGSAADAAWRVPVEILIDGSVYQTVWTQWAVEVWEERPVLLRDVAVGEKLAPQLVAMRRVRVRDAALSKALQVSALTGYAARRNLRAGETVERRDVEAIVLIQRGDTVELRVRRGAITARTRATALEDGRMGQRIEIVTKDTNQHMSAEVRGQGQVEVTIGSRRVARR
jgi:flagella basal body P-ring formation protein FlgA